METAVTGSAQRLAGATSVESQLTKEKNGSSYHHGDLANTLLDDALDHITQEGVQSLSLRALARQAGVSATAPYRHFASKRCLLAALATRGFRQLEGVMLAAQRSASPAASSAAAAERALMAMALAYVQFAIDHPTTYQLMFGSVLEDFSEYEALQRAAEQTYAVHNATLMELQNAGICAELETNLLGGTFWGGVHGVASLIIGNRAIGTQLQGIDLQAPGALQAIVALRRDPELALRTMFLPLLRQGMQQQS